jgi:hypothetical protein
MATSAYGRCVRCRGRRGFVCTNRFRVNANRHVIDVWLLFYCERCGARVKVPILEREPVSRISPQDLDAFHRNDVQLATRLGRDMTMLRRTGLSTQA